MGAAPEHYGKAVSLGGLDVVVTGHPAQIKSVGDDYWWKEGQYTGRAKNLPPRQSEADHATHQWRRLGDHRRTQGEAP